MSFRISFEGNTKEEVYENLKNTIMDSSKEEILSLMKQVKVEKEKPEVNFKDKEIHNIDYLLKDLFKSILAKEENKEKSEVNFKDKEIHNIDYLLKDLFKSILAKEENKEKELYNKINSSELVNSIIYKESLSTEMINNLINYAAYSKDVSKLMNHITEELHYKNGIAKFNIFKNNTTFEIKEIVNEKDSSLFDLSFYNEKERGKYIFRTNATTLQIIMGIVLYISKTYNDDVFTQNNYEYLTYLLTLVANFKL